MNLNLMTVSELRKLAAQFGIAGRSTMKKAELIAALSADEFAGSLEIMGGIAELEAEKREMNEIRAEIAAEDASVEETMRALANAEADAECERARRLAEYDAEDEAAYIEDGLKADADAGTYSLVNEVAVLRDAPGRAIVTAAFDGRTVGGSIVRKGKRLVLVAGTITVTGNSFEKVAKLFAMKLGFRADRIDVARGF